MKEDAFKMSSILFRPHCFLRQYCLHCAGFAQFILAMCISGSIFNFLTSNVEDRSLNLKYTWVVWALCTVGLVAGTLSADSAPVPLMVFRSGSGFDRRLSCFGLGCTRPIVGRFCSRRDRYTLLCVRIFVVIGGVRFELEHHRFWSDFGFGQGIVGGTVTRAVKSAHVRQSLGPNYLFIFCVCFESLLFA